MKNDFEKNGVPSFGNGPRSSRVVIYPKDIQLLTGKSYRHALYLNREVKEYYKKEKHQLLTIYEFGEYTGISAEIIRAHIL